MAPGGDDAAGERLVARLRTFAYGRLAARGLLDRV
jgi:hypothetical protein